MDYKNLENFFLSKLGIFLLFYLSILIGFYFDENALGGAEHDFKHHYEFSKKFNINFMEMFNRFGDQDMGTRNSPIFWIIISFLNKFLDIDLIRLLNSLISLLIGLSFFKCLKLKFKKQDNIILVLLACTIFLSPTIRSLSIWPYNLVWGLLFFILSIYNFLKFQNSFDALKKFKFSLKFLLYLIISSYIHPSFAIFILYYGFHLFLTFKLSKYLFYLIIYCLILSTPFFLYVSSTDVISNFYSAEGIGVEISQSLNIANKIVIISSMFLFFILPIINVKKLISEIKFVKFYIFIILLIFCLINIYYFNFPYIEGGGFGGGFFHKISNKIFGNNFFFFFIFIISLITIVSIFSHNLDNYILLSALILSNPQFTIYNKYFDPLIFVLFFTLFKIDTRGHFFEKKFKFLQLYSLILIYFLMSLLKSYVL